MQRYSYTALAGGGTRVSGTLRAGCRRDALAKLMERGYHPVRLSEGEGRGQLARKVWRRMRDRAPLAEVAALTRQLAALLRAQVPVVEALGVLEKQCARRRLAATVREVRQTLQRDAGTLADAMAEHPRVFGAVYCGLVRSGEEGGNLVKVLDGLAAHLSQAARVRSQVLTAFIYPVCLLATGLAAVTILVTFVIPQFQTLFESIGQQLPWPTRALMTVSSVAQQWWWLFAAAALAALAALWTVSRRPAVRARWHRALLRLPVFGGMLLKVEAASICRTLAALLAGGVRIVEALGITSRTVRNAAVAGTFAEVSRQVMVGGSLADALQRAQLYPPLMISLIHTGEESGQLPQMLAELAEVYQQESERAITDTVKLLEPVLILVMGLGVAGVVAAVILPIFQANLAAG